MLPFLNNSNQKSLQFGTTVQTEQKMNELIHQLIIVQVIYSSTIQNTNLQKHSIICEALA